MNLGEYAIDQVCPFYCTTHSSTTQGVVDADAAPTYRVYELTTDATVSTGTLAKLDDDNTAGFYAASETLSTANGYEAGKTYAVRISAVVGGVTATEVHTFTIRGPLLTASQITELFTAVRLSEAHAVGRVTVTDNEDGTLTYVFYAPDNATELATVTWTKGTGARTRVS